MKFLFLSMVLSCSLFCGCSGTVGTPGPDGAVDGDEDGSAQVDGDGGIDAGGDDGGVDGGDAPDGLDGADGDGGSSGDGDAAAPRCDDGIRNQGETGVDCGGPCDPCPSGTIYYVASDGDDAQDGLAPERAWRTIARVNQQTFDPGDFILFRRGDTWREQLRINASGTPAAYITYGAYGEGAKPRILGSKRAGDWTAVDGFAHVWRSGAALERPVSTYGAHPASIFFGGADGTVHWGTMQALEELNVCDGSFSFLTEEYDWCWSESEGAVFVYAPGNPGDRYAFVEVPQLDSIIVMGRHPPFEYIAIDGFELLYAIQKGYDDGWPMNVEVRGLTLQNCHIAYMGIIGADSAFGMQIWHSDMLVRNNEIHDCGRRSISYNVYGDQRDEDLVFENVVFEGNVLHHGYHTTGFDISNGWTDTFRHFVFRHNFVYDDPDDDPTAAPNDFTSMGLYLWPGGEFVDFEIHHNVFKNIKQKALALGGVHDLRIYHNVIYGMNPHIGDYRPMVSISGDYQGVRFANNIVYGNVDRSAFESRGVHFSGGPAGVVDMNHNLYFQEDPAQPILYISNHSYDMSEWAAYRAATGFDADSPDPQDPRFVAPATDDFSLEPGSPAVDRGLVIPGINDGFQGQAPDIGAFESPYSAE